MRGRVNEDFTRRKKVHETRKSVEVIVAGGPGKEAYQNAFHKKNEKK